MNSRTMTGPLWLLFPWDSAQSCFLASLSYMCVYLCVCTCKLSEDGFTAGLAWMLWCTHQSIWAKSWCFLFLPIHFQSSLSLWLQWNVSFKLILEEEEVWHSAKIIIILDLSQMWKQTLKMMLIMMMICFLLSFLLSLRTDAFHCKIRIIMKMMIIITLFI